MKSTMVAALLAIASGVAAQECPVPLVPHSTDRSTDAGVTTTMAIGETGGGLVWDATYMDNRHNVGYELWFSGDITATNTSDEDRTMKYHLSVPLYYTPMSPSRLVNACYESDTAEVVVRLEFVVPAGQTVNFTWDASAEFVDGSQGADFNGDYVVDAADLGLLYAAWGTDNPDYDLDGDGIVGSGDLGILLGAWSDSAQ